MIKGVIFDFNGTLFDDTDLQEEAWNVLVKKYLGRDLGPTEFSDCFHGLGNPDILLYLNAQPLESPLGLDVTDEKEVIYRQICREHPERVSFIPGVAALFDRLKEENIPFAIATASEITNVRFYFEMFGLEKWFTPDHVIYDDRSFPAKPAPDIFLKAAERLGLDPKDCIVCEDSLNGVRSAEAAGIGRIIARKPVLKPEKVISEPGVYAVIDDFRGFYEKFIESDPKTDMNILDSIPENTVVVPGESLKDLQHMLTPPTLQTCIRKPQDPAHVWWILSEEYPQTHPLQIVRGENVSRIALSDLKSDADILDNADYLVVPPLPAQYSLENFQNTVAILRGPHGCPWDKKQTHQTLRDDFLQEVYELLDGLDRNNLDMITEELGDVLLHVIIQAQIAVDDREFTMGDVAAHVNDKIVYRHQHVFGAPEDLSPDQVKVRWEQIKQKERAKQNKKGGLLDGINRAMPALSMAFSYQKRAAKTGFNWADEKDIWDKLKEELEEFRRAETPEEQEEELGDILFCIVNLARWHKVDPETALRMANLKFLERFGYIEQKAKETGKDLFEMPAEEKMEYWNEYKAAHGK